MRKQSVLLLIALSFSLTATAKAPLTDGEYSNEGFILSNLSSMPLAFTENQGQWDEKAMFKADAGGASFFFCSDEVAYLFVRDTAELIEDDVEGWHAFPKDKHAQVFDQSMRPADDYFLIEANRRVVYFSTATWYTFRSAITRYESPNKEDQQ